MIELKFNSDQVLEFNFNGEKIFSRSHIKVRDEAGNYSDYRIHFDHDSLTLKCDLGVYGYYQESFRVKGSAVHGRISVKVSTDKKFIVQCPAEYIKNTHPPYYMIPGFLYGTNNIATSDGLQPKFDYGGEPGYPNSSIFYIRSDRSANSSVIRISDGICSMLGIEHVVKDVKIKQIDKWSPAHLFTGLMLDSSMPDKDIAGFQIGYENYPYRYSWEREPGVPKYNEKLCGFIEDLSGEELEVESIYFIENAENNSEYGNALKEFYWKFHQLPLKVGKRRDAVNDIGQALISKGYNDKDKIFVLSDDAESMLLGDIAWTGGMQAAFPLLKAGLYADNNLFIGKAIEFIDNVCVNSFNNNSGLMNEEFRKGKWNVTGWWGTREDCFNFGEDPLHSAYLNGQFSYYLLKSFLLVDGNELWLETSKKLLDKVISSQRSDGRFGVFFDPGNGDAVDYDGFQGCWFVPALALMYKITSDRIYIESAESACDHYYSWHLKGELYNTPMDTHRAVDEEGNLAFIVAARELHEITKKTKYLEYGLKGIDWEFTWKFPFNKVYSNNPLRKINWSSSGGSITSTHNPSIHQMGNLVAGDIYYFYKITNDPYLKERLKDTCIWGLNAYNVYDGYLGFGKKGEATEQFTYTDGVVLPRPHPWDGGIWEANLPWAAACVLLSCAEDIPDEFFGE